MTDWKRIKARYEAGEKVTHIADTVDVTRQAISKRAKKEGWSQEGAKQLNVVAELPSLQAGNQNIRTPEAVSLILSEISQGTPKHLAANMAGMGVDTLNTMLKTDPAFSRLYREARARRLAQHVKNIHDAGDRGDWKASLKVLETAEETREEWGGKDKGNTLNVLINVPR